MKLRDIGTVYRKELLDLLRDRRTIVSMIVVPVLVMPLLMIGMGSTAAKLVTKARQEVPKVMAIGGEDSPNTLAGLRGLTNIELVAASEDFTNMISDKRIRAAVEIPKGFDAALKSGEPARVQIYIYGGEMKSSFGAEPIEQYFNKLHEKVVSERLASRNFPEVLLEPFTIEQTNVVAEKKVSGNVIGAIIPYLIILMCMTGAIYPAVDLTAGEKERGTMETLLCSPVAREDIVFGKCLMVLTASIATSVLSLSSMGTSFALLKQYGSTHGSSSLPFPLAVDPTSLLSVLAMMLPLAILFSAVIFLIGLFSRSSKEAQSYLQPLMIVIIMPSVASLLPGVELDMGLALIPVVNVSLVCKEIFAGTYHWNYIVLIFISTCVYAGLALFAAVAMFKRESVLFRA